MLFDFSGADAMQGIPTIYKPVYSVGKKPDLFRTALACECRA